MKNKISDKQISDKQKARQIILTSFLFIFSAVFSEGSNLYIPKNLISHSEESNLHFPKNLICRRFQLGFILHPQTSSCE